MNKTLLTILLMHLLIINIHAKEPTGKIVVTIDNFRNNKGIVYIYLYNSTAKNEYPKTNYVLTIKKTNITKHKASVAFDNLEYDDYAIQIHHDEDNNNKLKTGFFGIPKKGIGFSNGAKPKFGPPKFHKAKIILNSDSLNTHISVIYL